MVHVNLMVPRPSKRKYLIPLLISGCFLGLFLLLFPFSTRTPDSRPLLVEEREVVISVLIELEQKAPRFAVGTRSLRDAILRGSCIPTVNQGGEDLVHRMGSDLIFSDNFFLADSTTQENSMLQLIVSFAPKSDTGIAKAEKQERH